MIDKPGIYTISAEEYLQDPCPEPSLSASMASILCSSSPAHARASHPRLNPAYIAEEAEHFDIGTIAHALMLQGENIAAVLDFPDWRTAKAREARDAARAAGKVPILLKHFTKVCDMVIEARMQLVLHSDAKNAFLEGRPEQTIIWQESGIWCRARLDWLHDSHRFIDDYKSVGTSANPEAVSRTLFNNGGDIQAAWYIRGLKAIDPKADPIFRFVYQETFEPHALSVVSLSPDAMVIGEKKCIWAVDKWRECLESNQWPGYPTRTCYATLPPWEEQKWLAKETHEESFR